MNEIPKFAAPQSVTTGPIIGSRKVYAALAYYHDHRLEIDAQIAADGAFVEALHRVTPSKLEAKLKSSPGE